MGKIKVEIVPIYKFYDGLEVKINLSVNLFHIGYGHGPRYSLVTRDAPARDR